MAYPFTCEPPIEPPEYPEWECVECGGLYEANDPDDVGIVTDAPNVVVDGRVMRGIGGRWIICNECLAKFEEVDE
ncbi:MAG: hypothetical protein OCU12_07235 [Methanophagales archaeon]|nr:hypothetical protein [Methanophagales archaeon]